MIVLGLLSNSLKAETNFIIDKKLRCKPISNYLINHSKGDSLHYHISIQNTLSIPQDILIEIPIQLIDKVYVLQTENNKLLKQYVFESKNFKNRIYYDRNIVFPFTIDAKKINRITFKFHDNDYHSYAIPKMLLWKKDAKLNRMQALELTRGVFYGILALYIFICLFLSIFLKERNFFYYTFYSFTGAFYLFIKNNLAYELLWPNHPSIDIFIKKIILSVYTISSLIFLRGFLAKRIYTPILQKTLKYFIYFGLILILVSLVVGLLSASAQYTFIIIQNVFVIVCILTMIILFMSAFLNSNDKSMLAFTFIYFLAFTFFLFYPQPEFGNDLMGVFLGQIYTYSNAFVLGAIICLGAYLRINQIIKSNAVIKKQMSISHAQKNYSLINGQLNERNRVGQELHDGIGILLSATKMKLSSIKPDNAISADELKSIINDTDLLCNEIRTLSHNFLPPTLKKFGLQLAIKDILENFKNTTSTHLTYNLNVPDNIANVSQHVLYDFVKSFIDYFTLHKAEKLSINLYILPSIKEAQLRVNCVGTYINSTNDKIKSVIDVVNLLHGKQEIIFINAWNATMHIEIPILLEKNEPTVLH